MVQITSPILVPPLLLATDGSPSARIAQQLLYPISQALQLRRDEGETSAEAIAAAKPLVTILTVEPRRSSRSALRLKRKIAPLALPPATHHAPEDAPTSLSTETTSSVSGMEKAADRLVASIGAEFPPGLSVNLQVRQGRPATEILNCARTIHAGLIAVGHQGTGGVRELLLGSVSAVIARYAPCSVLIARADPFAEAGRQPALHHLLLVVDDLPVVRQVIGMVHQLIPAGVQRLTLLHVQAPLNVNYLYGPFVSSNPSWQLNQSLHEAQKEAGEHRLQQVKKAIALPNLDIQTLLQIGDAGSLICQVAQEQQVDLVVLSGKAARQSLLAPLQGLRRQRQQNEKTGDRRILRNTRLGPTGDYVIHHAPCPVLLCRTEEKARS